MGDIRLLGPITVAGPNGLAELIGARQRTICAALALRVGAVVPRTRLVDALWGDDPPPTADKTLNSHIARLRRALAECGLPEVLTTRSHGYVLHIEPTQVDVYRFEEQARAARAAAARGDLPVAASGLREGLALWRGAPLEDGEAVDWLAAEVARLDELRLAAAEDLWAIELSVSTGGPPEAIGELECLVSTYPFRERLWELLMVALYACGRQADALAAYRRARSILADQLGVEPGARLRRQHAAILAAGATEPLLEPAPERTLPASASPDPTVGTLPEPLTGIVGRDQAVRAVRELLRARRLVSLVGPAGSGKTRLAIAVGHMLDGVRFVDLTVVPGEGERPRTSAARGYAEGARVAGNRLADAVSTALGLGDQGTMDSAARLIRHLSRSHQLLIIDNCEHVSGDCAALLDRLLRACPELHVLATSRQPLRMAGEAVWPVPPLPPADATRLFLDRVRDHTGRTVPNAELPAVTELCTELDGLPLAIELAAARATALSVPEIAARLSDRFALLRNRDANAPRHHETLGAALDWSYGLIDGTQRALLRQMSVFVGGWRLDGAEAVYRGENASLDACGTAHGVRMDVLDLLADLVDRSLVVVDRRDGETRYRLLETVRAYASTRLAADPIEEEAAIRRHATYCVTLAQRATSGLRGDDQAGWLRRLAAEYPNLRAAMRRLLDRANEADDLRLATALGMYSQFTGHYRDGRRWLESALNRRSDAPEELKVPALRQAAALAMLVCEYPTAVRLAHEALSLTGPESCEYTRLLLLLASVERETGRYPSAMGHVEAALAHYRAVGDRFGVIRALHTGGFTAWLSGDLTGARRYLDECLPLVRATGDQEGIASALLSLGATAFYSGETERARRQLDEALERYRAIDFAEGIAWTLNILALVELRAGRDTEAGAHLATSLAIDRRLGDRWRCASLLEALAEVLHRAGSARQAAVALGAAGQIRAAIGTPVPVVERTDWERTYSAVRTELGEPTLLAAITEGHDRDLDELVAWLCGPDAAAEDSSPGQVVQHRDNLGTTLIAFP